MKYINGAAPVVYGMPVYTQIAKWCCINCSICYIIYGKWTCGWLAFTEHV
jgi:hypothetical protein